MVNFARAGDDSSPGQRLDDGVPQRLWALVALARHRLLLLDYDGTLAPFHTNRLEARAPEGLLELLARIRDGAGTTLAIVSGRPVAEVTALVGDLGVTIVGEHGWEMRTPDGQLVQRPLGHGVTAALDQARDAARRAGSEEMLERKRSALVLHVRGLPEDEARARVADVRGPWGAAALRAGLVLDEIDGGLELRARGRDKGTATLSLLSQAPAGTLAVFVGDDVTDEDAFAVVSDFGFGVRVGPGEQPSMAAGRLPSCEDVPAFLERWLQVTGR